LFKNYKTVYNSRKISTHFGIPVLETSEAKTADIYHHMLHVMLIYRVKDDKDFIASLIINNMIKK